MSKDKKEQKGSHEAFDARRLISQNLVPFYLAARHMTPQIFRAFLEGYLCGFGFETIPYDNIKKMLDILLMEAGHKGADDYKRLTEITLLLEDAMDVRL